MVIPVTATRLLYALHILLCLSSMRRQKVFGNKSLVFYFVTVALLVLLVKTQITCIFFRVFVFVISCHGHPEYICVKQS